MSESELPLAMDGCVRLRHCNRLHPLQLHNRSKLRRMKSVDRSGLEMSLDRVLRSLSRCSRIESSASDLSSPVQCAICSRAPSRTDCCTVVFAALLFVALMLLASAFSLLLVATRRIEQAIRRRVARGGNAWDRCVQNETTCSLPSATRAATHMLSD